MIFAFAVTAWLILGLLALGACCVGARMTEPEPQPEPVPASAAQMERIAA